MSWLWFGIILLNILRNIRHPILQLSRCWVRSKPMEPGRMWTMRVSGAADSIPQRTWHDRPEQGLVRRHRKFPYNTTPGKGFSNAVVLSDFAKLMERPSVAQVFIIDACRELFTTKSVTSNRVQGFTKKGLMDTLQDNSKYGIICACSDGAYSHESKTLKGGYFTAMFVDSALEKLDAGQRLALMGCADDVDLKLGALQGIINESFPPQPPWALGENLILHEGDAPVSFSIAFHEAHRDIDREYEECDLCGVQKHFLDVRRCACCHQNVCRKHYVGKGGYCETCRAKEPLESNGDSAVQLSRQLAKRKIIFLHAYDNIASGGTIVLKDDARRKEVEEGVCEYLFSEARKMEPGLNPKGELERGMILEVLFRISPLEFLKELSMRKYLPRRDWLSRWDRFEEKSRRVSLLGEYDG